MCKNKEIDHKKLEGELRKKMPNCNEAKCEKGDFQKMEFPKGVVVCQGCRVEDDSKYGQVAIMPEGFKMPSSTE